MRDPNAWHIMARSRGVQPSEPSLCAVCGESPFAVAKRTRDVVGPNFSDFDALHDPAIESVCACCASLLGGKPGSQPPPMRMRSFCATEGGEAVYPKRGEVRNILLDPPRGRFVLVWANSGKKHAWLRAGISTSERMAIGADDGTVIWDTAQGRELLDAVAELRHAFKSADILSGSYRESAIRKIGAMRWSALEHIVAQHRGTLRLDLATWCTTKDHVAPPLEEAEMIDDSDEKAAEFLAALASASSIRANDGKMFWAGFFRHRVERVRRLGLSEMVSRLMDTLDVSATSPSTEGLLDRVRSMTPEDEQSVLDAIRERTALVVALSFDRVKRSRPAEPAKPAFTEQEGLFA